MAKKPSPDEVAIDATLEGVKAQLAKKDAKSRTDRSRLNKTIRGLRDRLRLAEHAKKELEKENGQLCRDLKKHGELPVAEIRDTDRVVRYKFKHKLPILPTK